MSDGSAIIGEFLQQYYRAYPVNATFTGIHEHDARLPDWSVAARAREQDELRALLAKLEHASPTVIDDLLAPGHDSTGLDAVLACANIQLRLAEEASGHFYDLNPALWTGEAIFGIVSLMIRDFASADERLPFMTARLLAVEPFLSAMPATITRPIPERWRDRAVRECTAAIELFSDGLDRWIIEQRGASIDFPSDNTPQLKSVRAAAAAAGSAFALQRDWLQRCAAAEPSAYAAGRSLLETAMRHGHFCQESPDSLLLRVEADMQLQQSRLAVMLAEHGLNWSEAAAQLAAGRSTTAAYYESFAKRWQEIRTAVVAQNVVTWPDWPIRYVPIPGWARRAQPQLYWLFYRSPAPFDQYGIYNYLVTPVEADMSLEEQTRRLSAWNQSVITLNHVVHHGGLGHHVQNWNAVHQARSQIGKIAAVDCANRIGMFLGGSMAEGWACYATDLAEELGLLTDLEKLSQQHTRVRQAARAIVDINLHSGTWSFEQSARYYEQQTGMSADMANAETTKNSMFPGTALMYWLGTTSIADARSQLQQTLGDRFDLCRFHDELLSRGAIPVLLATRLMTAANGGIA